MGPTLLISCELINYANFLNCGKYICILHVCVCLHVVLYSQSCLMYYWQVLRITVEEQLWWSTNCWWRIPMLVAPRSCIMARTPAVASIVSNQDSLTASKSVLWMMPGWVVAYFTVEDQKIQMSWHPVWLSVWVPLLASITPWQNIPCQQLTSFQCTDVETLWLLSISYRRCYLQPAITWL